MPLGAFCRDVIFFALCVRVWRGGIGWYFVEYIPKKKKKNRIEDEVIFRLDRTTTAAPD